MEQYIDKSSVVAEIERRQSIVLDPLNNNIHTKRLEETYKSILSFINTLKVKEVKEEPVSNDLERAALLHYPKMSRISEPHGFIPADNKSHYLGDANEDKRKAFIVGAQWQKQQNVIEMKVADLEKEKDNYWNKLCDSEFGELLERDAKWFDDIAKHFFELGLKYKK